jgi:hypothetical protein
MCRCDEYKNTKFVNFFFQICTSVEILYEFRRHFYISHISPDELYGPKRVVDVNNKIIRLFGE